MDPQIEAILALIIFFFGIFDPPVSVAVFAMATKNVEASERRRAATLAVGVAALISLAVLLLGEVLLELFRITIDNFKVAGGIILALLGIKMALGHSLTSAEGIKSNSAKAIAAIIATPMLTGPAAITSIIVSVEEYGRVITGGSVAIVLAITAIMLYQANTVSKWLGETATQAISTVLGLITVGWGVSFIRAGLGV